MDRFDTLWTGARLATMQPGSDPYGTIAAGAIACRGERIAWVGPEAQLPHRAAGRVVDLGGQWVTPGLIDCHTHLIFAGERVGEWERRLEGEDYAQIARSGGGIARTVRLTRAAGEAELFTTALARLHRLRRSGVTTVEVKSGYGLDLEGELKLLRVARALAARSGLTVRTTLLAAHALPPEYAQDRSGYLDGICEQMIPAAARAGLADAVDAYCEQIAFSPAEVARVFESAAGAGLAVKLHADQLSDGGGAALAARYRALSADHLEYTSAAGVRALAAAGTVAVLLPGAFYSLHQTRRPPVAALRRYRVPMAVATDCNPGTSPLLSLPLAMNLACTLFGLTPAEALAGATRCAARALGLAHQTGVLAPGLRCDLAIWPIERPAEIAYWLGGAAPSALVVGGLPVAGLSEVG